MTVILKELRDALVEAGASPEKADAAAGAVLPLARIDDLATRADLEALRLSTKAGLEALGLSTKADIEALRLSTEAGLDALRLSTKAGLEALGLSTKADIDALRLSTKADIDASRLSTEANLVALRSDIDGLRREMRVLYGLFAAILLAVLGTYLRGGAPFSPARRRASQRVPPGSPRPPRFMTAPTTNPTTSHQK